MTTLSPMADPARLPPSLWAATAEAGSDTPPWEGEGTADIVVVGGGYTGLSAAIAAARQGARVIVVEAGEPGWGASGRNGGQIIPGLKWDPDEVEAKLGTERGGRLVTFSAAAPDTVFELIKRYDIACAAQRPGWLQPVHSAAARKTVLSRIDQWQRRGAPVEYIERDQAYAMLGARGYLGAMLDRRGGALNPLSFARGLARAAISEGAAVHGHSRVIALRREREGWRVETARGRISAASVILATNAYECGLVRDVERSLIPVASFIIATEPLAEDVGRTILPHGHAMSDTRRLLLYCRKDPAGRLIMGGRGKLRDPTRSTDFDHVDTAMRRLYPQIGAARVIFRWSGRLAVTADHLPRINEPAPGLLAVYGYNGRGVAMATALGAAAGAYVATGNEETLPMSITPVKPLPFPTLKRIVLGVVSTWMRMRDATSPIR